MTIGTLVRAAVDHAAEGDQPEILVAILRETINLAVWQRRIRPALPPVPLWPAIDDIGVTTDIGAVEEAIRAALDDAGYPDECVAALGTDIAGLSRRFADIADCDAVSIRLEIVETDACRRFHADNVTVRLISTFAGRATQWLSNADAASLRGGADLSDLMIRSLTAGDVALFKGRRWSPEGAIVHRSPPIAATGEQRLVLVIDPASPAAITIA